MHAVWKGSISFGLVNIPINMYSASESRELKFKLLHKKDLSEVGYSRICKREEREIPWKEVVKGYEIDGRYIVMTEEDFQKASLKTTRSIEILDFTDEHQVDTIYYDAPYFLEPQKEAAKAYALLFEALKRSRKVAVGRFVFHNHEHLGIIRIYKDLLLLHTLRYQANLKDFREVKPPKAKISKVELQIALELIEKLSSPFHPEKYKDTYIQAIKARMKKKGRGEKIRAKERVVPSRKGDILSLLKESLHKKKVA
ncbi:MAG TPA: Ku protein [Chlamydiales bacterium]|nr:Ku protein [Chlamydiales bacterium]